MAKYRKKPIVIEATQWHKNGDHPLDYSEPSKFPPEYRKEKDWEGCIVKLFRDVDTDPDKACAHCGRDMYAHGWIDTKEGGHIVCPGDWIITGIQGEHYPCKPDIFAATYDPVEDPPGSRPSPVDVALAITKAPGSDKPVEPWTRILAECIERDQKALAPVPVPAPEPQAIPDWALQAAYAIIQAEGEGELFRRVRSELQTAHGGRYPGIDAEATKKTWDRLAQMILARMPKPAEGSPLIGTDTKPTAPEDWTKATTSVRVNKASALADHAIAREYERYPGWDSDSGK